MAKQKNTYSIAGRIIDAKTRPVAGLRVEAWDKDLICNDLVGSAVTDDQGKFRIEFTQSHFKELFPDRKPDLFFKVYQDDTLIKSTKDSVLWNLDVGGTVIEFEVDIPMRSGLAQETGQRLKSPSATPVVTPTAAAHTVRDHAGVETPVPAKGINPHLAALSQMAKRTTLSRGSALNSTTEAVAAPATSSRHHYGIATTLAPDAAFIEPVHKLLHRLDIPQEASLSQVRVLANEASRSRNQRFTSGERLLLLAYSSLASVFPPHFASILAEAGADGLVGLQKWTVSQFKEVLRTAKLTDYAIDGQAERFGRMQAMVAGGASVTAIDGLGIDIDSDVPEVNAAVDRIRRRGVANLSELADISNLLSLDMSYGDTTTKTATSITSIDIDGVTMGTGTKTDTTTTEGYFIVDGVKLESNYVVVADIVVSVTDILIASSHLSGLGAPHWMIMLLLTVRVHSALQLALLNRQQIDALCKSRYLPDLSDDEKIMFKSVILELKARAMQYVSDVGQMLTATLRSGSTSLPGWLTGVWDQHDGGCNTCTQDESAFSRYAYFLYLIRISGESAGSLDLKIRQGLNDITASSGRTVIPQIDICNDVLNRAYGPLNDAERMPYRRRIVIGLLALAGVTVDQAATDAIAEMTGTLPTVGNLSGRLRQAIGALLNAPVPSFTMQELSALETTLRRSALAKLKAQVRTELTFGGAPDNVVQTEAEVRLTVLLEPARQEASMQMRDALKCKSGIDDMEIFLRHFIEVDLDPCVTISRLDQAIRSVQAWLEQKQERAISPDQRARYVFSCYERWRAKIVFDLYPELAALGRDDVLVTTEEVPAGNWNRGSILSDHANARAELRRRLADVRSAIKDGRVSQNGSYSGEHFDSHSYQGVFARFLGGLDVIEQIISADDLVQKALSEGMDKDQPSIALHRLWQGSEALDQAIRLAFVGDPATQDDRVLDYPSLLAMDATTRRQTLEQVRLSWMSGTKAIFHQPIPAPQITGLDLSSGFFQSLDGWRNDENAYRRGDSADGPSAEGRLIKLSTGRGREPLYVYSCIFNGPDSQELQNYHLESYIRINAMADYSSMGSGGHDLVGVVVRAKSDSHACYRLVVWIDMVEGADSGAGNPETEGHECEVNTGYKVLDYVAHELCEAGTPPVPGSEGEDQKLHTAIPPRYYLQLQRVDSNGAYNEVARDPLEFDFEWGGTYIFKVDVRDNRLTGKLILPNGTTRHIPWTIINLLEGSFGYAAGNLVDAVMGPLYVQIEQPQPPMPPFYASRRKEYASRYPNADFLGDCTLMSHKQDWKPLAGNLLLTPLLYNVPQGTSSYSQRLEGVHLGAGTAQLYLVFAGGQRAVLLNALDWLLDECLSLAYYLKYASIPIRMAQAHFSSGDYARAVAMYHLVYDDTAYSLGADILDVVPEEERQIFPYLTVPPPSLGKAVGYDSTLMRLRIGEVYLAWADWLFRQNTADSRYEARRLADRVFQLYGDEHVCGCGKVYKEIRQWLQSTLATVLYGDSQGAPLYGYQITRDVQELLDGISEMERLGLAKEELGGTLGWLRSQTADTAAELLVVLLNLKIRLQPLFSLSRSTSPRNVGAGNSWRSILSLFCKIEKALQLGTTPLVSFSPNGGRNATPFVSDGWVLFSYISNLCIPPNPLVVQQKQKACILLKLNRSCRNALGYKDDLVPPLRFEALLRQFDRFSALATEAEHDLQDLRQRSEQGTYSMLEATRNLQICVATVAAEQTKIQLAQGDIREAVLQLGQANFNADHYNQLLQDGLTIWEEVALGSAWAAFGFHALAALPAMAAVVQESAGAAVGIAGMIATVAGGGVPTSIPSAVSPETLGSAATAMGTAAGALSSAASMQASFERRAQEWQYQLGLSRFGAAMAQEGVMAAMGRYNLAVQQAQIAEIDRQFAADMVQFLDAKFLNQAMLLWMLRTMRDQYRIRLNYANTAAFMAERALSFELQEPVSVVRLDYFDPQRDGLLGATQLKTDVASLEAIKLSATTRKLQLSKTLSLERTMPMEFQQFKDGLGKLVFHTPMEWFDRDFPGHYLRMIKSVRVSLIALVPPHEGIHAILSNNGVSTVVTGPDFRKQIVRRFPETIALSSTTGANGMFVLDYKDDLLLPFEGSGVDTDWTFELPRAANRFSFGSIADVLFTIDYTALPSDAYRRQVIAELSPTVSADRVFSFRRHLPDQWYHLHQNNGTAATTPIVVGFRTDQRDFPGDLDNPSIVAVSLFFGHPSSPPASICVEYIRFTPDGETTVTGGAMTAVPTSSGAAGGWYITSRNGSTGYAQNWSAIVGKKPIGQWEIGFARISTSGTGATAKPLFSSEALMDILLVISFAGSTKPWP